MTRPLRYRETAAKLRDMADQMRWAENRDYLLNLAERFADLADPANERTNATALYLSSGK